MCHDWLYEHVAVVGVGEPIKVHPVLVKLESLARNRTYFRGRTHKP